MEPAFAAALKAMTEAGVKLVEFDVGLMLAEQALNAHDQFTYVYEMPRELSRCLFFVLLCLYTPLFLRARMGRLLFKVNAMCSQFPLQRG